MEEFITKNGVAPQKQASLLLFIQDFNRELGKMDELSSSIFGKINNIEPYSQNEPSSLPAGTEENSTSAIEELNYLLYKFKDYNNRLIHCQRALDQII